MPRLAHLLRRCLLPLCGVVALWLAGCGEGERMAYATEADEPYYREGQALLKSGRKQEALSAFLKVIERRIDSPESHLEVGLLYQQHINDPLSAIYHFKKYLALRPNSPQSGLVKQRIDSAIREFAQTLPAQPLDSQAQRVDLIATLDKLKLENDQLKQQVADLKSGKSDPDIATVRTDSVPSLPGTRPVAAPPAPLNFSLETMPTVRTTPARTVTAPAAPQPKANTSRSPATVTPTRTTATPTPAKPAVRKHTVGKGDTLMNIALKYYGNRSKWRDIYAANRNVMKNESDIRVGMELVLP